MIRITVQPKDNHTLVTIDGRAEESDLKEIRRIRKSVEGDVILNLKELAGCDAEGVQFLRSWLEAGAKLQEATPFMRMILGKPSESHA